MARLNALLILLKIVPLEQEKTIYFLKFLRDFKFYCEEKIIKYINKFFHMVIQIKLRKKTCSKNIFMLMIWSYF